MGMFSNLRKNVKSAVEKTATGIKKGTESVQKQLKRNQDYKRLKEMLLKNATLSDLKKICKEFGVAEPSMYYKDPFSGKRTKKRDTPKTVYLRHVIKNVDLDKLIEFFRKRRVNVSEILSEKSKIDEEFSKPSKYEANGKESDEFTQIEITKKKVNDLDLILEKIDKEFDFDRIRDENELEGLIAQFLKICFKDKKIDRQYKTDKGTFDIVIDGKYGVEIKIAENSKIIENLIGQLIKYVKFFGKNKVAVIVLKTPKTNINVLEEYAEYYENTGAKVLILDKGTLKRRKSNVKTFKLVK